MVLTVDRKQKFKEIAKLSQAAKESIKSSGVAHFFYIEDGALFHIDGGYAIEIYKDGTGELLTKQKGTFETAVFNPMDDDLDKVMKEVCRRADYHLDTKLMPILSERGWSHTKENLAAARECYRQKF